MILINIILILNFFLRCTCYEPEVNLKYGTVRGFTEKVNEVEVNVFLGVPFAEPPLSEKRFRLPVSIKNKFQEVIEAKQWRSNCMQKAIESNLVKPSEDCLYLNIWTSVNLSNHDSKQLKPVMIFIPGGGFTFGGNSEAVYNSTILSAVGDVVVVTVNYRLGVFGFLYSGNDEAPGNIGLFDQKLALEWIRENIEKFGGDKEQMTLFGESAGAMSVGFHLISSQTRCLFKNAIVMSGVGLEHFLAVESKQYAIQKAITIAKLVGCEANDGQSRLSQSTMKCLRRVDAQKLLEAQFSPNILQNRPNSGMLPFIPIFGDRFLPQSVKRDWLTQNFKKNSNLLIGLVPNDGIVAYALTKNLIKEDTFYKIARYYFSNFFPREAHFPANEVTKLYFTPINSSDERESEKAFYRALSDILFNCPSAKFAKEFSKSNVVYQYLFEYQGANGVNCDGFGPCHADELPFTFGTVQNETNEKTSLEWIKLLSTFAKSGALPWPKYERVETKFLFPFYYRFTGNSENDKIDVGYRAFHCQFWEESIFNRIN